MPGRMLSLIWQGTRDLPPDLIDRADLRIDPDLFRKQLLADQRLILGRFDARVTGLDPNPAASYT